MESLAIQHGRRGFVRRDVAGVPFAVSTLDDAADWLIHEAARSRLPVNVRLANAYNVALADKDPSYAQLLREQGINFPDGTPVVWVMNCRRGGSAFAGRVRGPSLFAAAMRQSATSGVRHFLLGTTERTLAALTTHLTNSYPGITIAGTYSPPFAPADENFLDQCEAEASRSNPDLIWVGLGTPKQDHVGTALAERLRIPTVNVGAAFDFAAGTLREAPVWVQNSGWEWLYRLACEPRRLWRRYVFGNARFLLAVARTSVSASPSRKDAHER